MSEARFKTIGYLRRRRSPGEQTNKPANTPTQVVIPGEEDEQPGAPDSETGADARRTPGGVETVPDQGRPATRDEKQDSRALAKAQALRASMALQELHPNEGGITNG